MNQNLPDDAIRPVGASLGPHVEVLETTMRIHELSIDRADVVAYLRNISPDKQEVALVHAIQVGITEILARRGRIQH